MIGALAAGAHAVYGNVDLRKGLLIGAPAVAGVVAGTAVQQRISERLSFAAVPLALAWQPARRVGPTSRGATR